MNYCLLALALVLAQAAPALAQPTLLFEDNFEVGELNPAAWSARPGLSGPDGLVELGNYGADRSRGVYLGRSADGDELTVNALDLRLDLAGQTGVTLDFSIASNFDETQAEDGLFFSDDGGATFAKALAFDPDDWCNLSHAPYPTVDVDRRAAALGLSLTADFVIRFQQGGLDDTRGGSTTSEDGLLLDDVRVESGRLSYARLPFADDFESSERLGRPWSRRAPLETTAEAPMDRAATPMARVGHASGLGVDRSQALLLTRHCDGPSSVSAADLHLDLSAETQVELGFEIATNFDEFDPEDGVFFSDDGGASFGKIADFRGDEWCNRVFGAYPPIDLDAAAARIGRSLTARSVIRFQQSGSRDLAGGASASEDGILIDEVRVYAPGLEYAGLPFADDFELGRLGAAWRQGSRLATSTLPLDNSREGPMTIADALSGEGRERSFGLFLGRRCDGPFTASAADLHLDLSGADRPLLTFDVRSNFEETQADDGIYFSDDGGEQFAKAVALEPAEWCVGEWGTYPPIDIAAVAEALGIDLTDRFVVRFQQFGRSDRGGNAAAGEDGLAIDNVRVTDEAVVYASVPFEDDFENARFEAHWRHRPATETATVASDVSVTTPMGRLEVAEGAGLDRSYGALFGRHCDGPFAVNALDLHLDLNEGRDVTLAFALRNNFDETDADDGLYLSTDGGEGFTKVFAFDLSDRPNDFEAYSVDLSEAAERVGLRLTSRSVVRFQQRGNRDFAGNSAAGEDGYTIDDVVVTGTTVSDVADVADAPALSVYPNPATDRLQVEGGTAAYREARIVDGFGRVLYRWSGGRLAGGFDVSPLADGHYVLLLVREDGELRRARFVKQ